MRLRDGGLGKASSEQEAIRGEDGSVTRVLTDEPRLPAHNVQSEFCLFKPYRTVSFPRTSEAVRVRGEVVGREIVYCNRCGDRITSDEFEKGRAITVLGKNYCRKCMKAVVEPDEAEGPSGVPPEREARRSGEGSRSRKAPPPFSGRAGKPAPGTTKIPVATAPGWLPRDSTTRVSLLVGLAILVLALILLVVVLRRG